MHPGDHIWWDRHDWSQTDDIPAVVGSFPEPFLNGIDGKRLPVRVECADGAGAPAGTVTGRLRARGRPGRRRGARRRRRSTQTLRVLVGAVDASSRGDPAARAIEQGPRASGVYARFSAAETLTLLDQNGRARGRSAPARG